MGFTPAKIQECDGWSDIPVDKQQKIIKAMRQINKLDKDELSKGGSKTKRPKKATTKFDPVAESTPTTKRTKSRARPNIQSQGKNKSKVGSHMFNLNPYSNYDSQPKAQRSQLHMAKSIKYVINCVNLSGIISYLNADG